MSVTNILISGVGGQGTVLAGDVIGMAARLAGLQVKASEVHGMSQRGGSVISEVRFGDQVNSPLIPPPGADFVLGMELLEGLRAAGRLRPGGLLIVNRQRIVPASVTYGKAEYPPQIEERIRAVCPDALIVDALGIAGALGNPRAANVVLLGLLSTRCALPLECWTEALARSIKPRFLEDNLEAFHQGRAAAAAPAGSEA